MPASDGSRVFLTSNGQQVIQLAGNDDNVLVFVARDLNPLDGGVVECSSAAYTSWNSGNHDWPTLWGLTI